MLQVKKHTIILLIIFILVCDLVIFWHFLVPHTSPSLSSNKTATTVKNAALTIEAYHKGDNVNSYIQAQMATCIRLAGATQLLPDDSKSVIIIIFTRSIVKYYCKK